MNVKALIAAAVVVALAGSGYAALRYTGLMGSQGCCSSGAPAPGGSTEPATQLPADDATLIASQVYCPIMPETKLGEMGQPVKILVKDKAGVEQPVFVCCKGCKRKVLANPEAALAKVAEFKAAAERAGP